ncbi:hypothetical protein E1B28_010830 [Marasmius oreades]|uniref:DUF6533 domain-containing protein n=1 Tax=Marasmius oreades TaxID=181124 RepID=A0A9P7RTD2_9AGAR|nr:uncharacterized protein E1B28_010830 [Marasmius oreades]KAG7089122.1 hypothetical protein E1B28_010830 [Marasmius oreades]
MADVSAAETAMIIEALTHQRIVAHVDVFITALLVCEIIINLPVEIEHIWMKRWSYLTVLYIIQRYLPFFDTAVMVLNLHFGENLSTRDCTLNYNISAWCFIVGIVLSEILLTLRVWAVWQRSLPVAIGLSVFFFACWVPCYVLFAQSLSAAVFATLPLPNFRGCLIANGDHIIFLWWVLMMVYDTGILVAILIPGVAAYRRGGRSELVRTVYHDGVIYYALIFLVSTINVIVTLALPPDLVLLLTSFERVLHSILTSRSILHIRQIGAKVLARQHGGGNLHEAIALPFSTKQPQTNSI